MQRTQREGGDSMTLEEVIATAGKETEDKNKKKPYTSMHGNTYWLTDEEAEKRNNTAIMVLIGAVLLVIITLALAVIYDIR